MKEAHQIEKADVNIEQKIIIIPNNSVNNENTRFKPYVWREGFWMWLFSAKSLEIFGAPAVALGVVESNVILENR